MKKKMLPSDPGLRRRLRAALPRPADALLSRSRAGVLRRFRDEASLIQWGSLESPLGPVFVAVNARGLCAVDIGDEARFLQRLDPRARLEKNLEAVRGVLVQLREYFSRARASFDIEVDLSPLTPFQRSVLETARRIKPGHVWTYHQVARELGRSDCSRAVGQALARNPVPIVIPCHRVVASNGTMRGYSGGSGIEAKRWLLRLEGALSADR